MPVRRSPESYARRSLAAVICGALLAAENPPVHAGRVFTRTDRVIVRTSTRGHGASPAKVMARLIDRRGATLAHVPLRRSTMGDAYELELPLASVAAGEFALVFEARSGEAHAEALVPFRVSR
jgi:hypothetical protein